MTGTLVSDAPLAHLRWGEGPVVLLLHGIGGGREVWSDDLSGTGSALAEAGFQAVAVDFPGYGLSPTIEPFALGGMAQSLQRLMAWLGAPRVALVGHSMGGMVAQELVAQAPQCVNALVLASTSPAFGKPEGDWQQDFLRSRFAPLDAGLGMAGMAAQLVPTMLAPGTAPEAAARMQALMGAVPEATYRQALSALVAFDRRAALAAIQVPTWVVTGEHDHTAAPAVAARMAQRIAGATLSIIPGAGHLLTMEQPAAFNSGLLQFLAGALR